MKKLQLEVKSDSKIVKYRLNRLNRLCETKPFSSVIRLSPWFVKEMVSPAIGFG